MPFFGNDEKTVAAEAHAEAPTTTQANNSNAVDNSASENTETDKIVNYLINSEKILHKSKQILNKTVTDLSDEDAQKQVEEYLEIDPGNLKTEIDKLLKEDSLDATTKIQDIEIKIRENVKQMDKLINNMEINDILQYRILVDVIKIANDPEKDDDFRNFIKKNITGRHYDDELTKTRAAWEAYMDKISDRGESKGGSKRKTRKSKKSKKARKSRKH
jgi:hypothetical protein